MNKQVITKIHWIMLCLLALISTLASALPGDQRYVVTTGGSIGSSPAIDAATGNVFVGSADNYVYSYDATLTTLNWRFDTGAYVGSSPSISSDAATLYVGAYNGIVFALDTTTGNEKWRFVTGGAVYSSPAVSSDGTVYVGSDDTHVYALDPATGQEIWRYQTGGAVGSSPVIGKDGTLYVGSADGKLYALDPAGTDATRFKWSYLTLASSGVTTPSIGLDGTIYVGGFDNKLYAIDETGVQKWVAPLGGRVASSPAVAPDGTVYVGSYDNGALNAINPTDGTIIWSYITGGNVYSSPAIGADGTVYIGSFNNNAYAITPSLYDALNPDPNHMVKWTFTADSGIASSPTITSDGTVYLGSTGSKLFAIEENSGGLALSSWPMFRRDIKHTANGIDTNGLDTDGDGFNDDIEIDNNSDPNDITSIPVALIMPIIQLILNDDPVTVDTDGDGVNDTIDVFPNDPLEWADLDSDGIGDNSDPDIDGDDVNNSIDVFPNNPLEWADLDSDGTGDNSDLDTDGDGIVNTVDNCVRILNFLQIDNNLNGIGDLCEPAVINGFSPSNVNPGGFIYIFGKNFKLPNAATSSGNYLTPEVCFVDVYNPSNEVCTFLVQVVSDEMLIALYPAGAPLETYIKVTVKVNTMYGIQVLDPTISDTIFGRITSSLSVNGIWPGEVNVNPLDTESDLVFVFGNNFDLTPGGTQVTVTDTNSFLTQVSASDMLITIILPTMSSGPICVTAFGSTKCSPVDLTISILLPDADADGVMDSEDSCMLVPNADLRDTNNDGYGNICDADLNNDGFVDDVDVGMFFAVYPSTNPDADFNGDGAVNSLDLNILKSSYNRPPGPSGLAP